MLREISLGYDAAEDRIHLQLRLREAEGDRTHHLHLTRRISLGLREALQELVRRSAQVPGSVSTQARQALEAGHHKARLQQTAIQTERRSPPSADDEVIPRLVVGVRCGTRAEGKEFAVRFELRGGPPLTLALSERTLHALAASLDDRVRRAQWVNEVTPPLSQQATATEPPAGLH